MNAAGSSSRLTSLDQFRGYSVAAMFVVNFLQHQAVTHHLLKHNNTHFSYADSIMPSFLFICGLSYRMSFVRRSSGAGWPPTAWRFVRRSMGLLLFSLMLFGFDATLPSWSALTPASAGEFVILLVKARLWQILAIIGAVQLLILPVIAASVRLRIAALMACAVTHVLLSWSFNYDFVYGRPNWMDEWWGSEGKRAWDGGCFGLISWAEVMLAGSLAHDLLVCHRPAAASGRLVGYGALLMLVGYALSCLATLYDVEGASTSRPDHFAVSPVWPPFEKAVAREWHTLLAPPPFVPPPPPSARLLNYWMMDKRVVTQSFMLFGAGFSAALYGLFVLASDVRGWESGVLRTFGQNPLAAYVTHYLVAHSILNVVPEDSPLWWTLVGLAAFLTITYLYCRFLERESLYLRL